MFSQRKFNNRIEVRELKTMHCSNVARSSFHMNYDHPAEFQAAFDILLVPNKDSADFISLNFSYHDKTQISKPLKNMIFSILKKNSDTLIIQGSLNDRWFMDEANEASDFIIYIAKLTSNLLETREKNQCLDQATTFDLTKMLFVKFSMLLQKQFSSEYKIEPVNMAKVANDFVDILNKDILLINN